LTRKLKTSVDRFVQQVLPAGADGQVHSGAVRYGMHAVAGELATDFGVVPWQNGEPPKVAAARFKLWVAGRGGVGAADDITAVKEMRSLLSAPPLELCALPEAETRQVG